MCRTFCSRLTAAAFLCWLVVGVGASPLQRRRFVLDSRLGGVQVQAAILNVLVDPLRCLQEGLLHVLASAGEAEAERVRTY